MERRLGSGNHLTAIPYLSKTLKTLRNIIILIPFIKYTKSKKKEQDFLMPLNLKIISEHIIYYKITVILFIQLHGSSMKKL